MSLHEESVVENIIDQIIGNEAVVKKLAFYALLAHEYANNDETTHITEIYMPAARDLGEADGFKICLSTSVEQSPTDPAGYDAEFYLYAVKDNYLVLNLLTLTPNMEFEYNKVILGGIINKELAVDEDAYPAPDASKALYLSMVSVMDVVNKDFADLVANRTPIKYADAVI